MRTSAKGDLIMFDSRTSEPSNTEFIYGAKHDQDSGFLAGFLFGLLVRSRY
jgi:hypothetical protein